MRFQQGDLVRLSEYGLMMLAQCAGFRAIGWDGITPVAISEIGKDKGIDCAILRWNDLKNGEEADDAEITIGFDWLEAAPSHNQIN